MAVYMLSILFCGVGVVLALTIHFLLYLNKAVIKTKQQSTDVKTVITHQTFNTNERK